MSGALTGAVTGALEAVAITCGAADDLAGWAIVATGTTGGCHGFDPNDGS
jgi:hypothetical protein